ncbi:MAG: hypothetical protein Q7R95_08620, partial [bacterium]|nr:hypothetical protein [bacterium]
KWQEINSILIKSDYIIIASNRLYIPLQKLSDCSKYSKCYPITAKYFKRLFNNQIGFEKIKEFSSLPHFQILNMKFDIDDSSADESFTVYDHPKIFIFKKD